MKRILYDLSDVVLFASGNSHVTGIQRVQIDVFNRLKTRTDVEVIPVYFSPLARRYLKFDVDRIFSFDRRYARRLLPNLRYRILNEAYRRLRRLSGVVTPRKDDTIFVGGAGWAIRQRRTYLFPLISKLDLHVVWMFFDLIPISRPEYVPAGAAIEFKSWLDDALSYPASFYCISDYSRFELVEYAKSLGKDAKAITTPLAHELSATSPSIRHELMYLRREKFVLAVGSIEIRKNHLQLARIWSTLFKERGHNCPILVLVGKYGWLIDRLLQYLQGTSWVFGQIIHVVDASDAELNWLYQHCQFTVFPSLFEGWGLPIGESLWMGKHCVCYDVTSHKEAGGSYAVYCDPKDPNSLETEIRIGIDNGFQIPLPDRSALRTWSKVGDDISEALISHTS